MTEIFEGWLAQGLGRAAIHIGEHDSRPYRAALLHACTHFITFDGQCEEGREWYLRNLIEISGDREFYRDALLRAVGSDDPEIDLGQLFGVLALFSPERDTEIKQNMYAAFDRWGFEHAGVCAAEELVRLDGVHALQFVLRSFAAVPADDRTWQFRSMMEMIRKHHGSQPLPPEAEVFLKESEEEQRLRQPTRPDPVVDYEIARRSLTRGQAMAWARKATDDQLALAAEDLRQESDPERLRVFLQIFRFRQFPQPIDRLLDLACDSDPKVARPAVVALQNVTDSRIRALGLELATTKQGRNTAGLLAKNAEPDDYRLLEKLLEDTAGPLTYHWLVIDVREHVEANPSPEAVRSLHLIYEHSPCSLCRNGAVDELIKLRKLPEWMRQECLHDADAATRKAASATPD